MTWHGTGKGSEYNEMTEYPANRNSATEQLFSAAPAETVESQSYLTFHYWECVHSDFFFFKSLVFPLHFLPMQTALCDTVTVFPLWFSHASQAIHISYFFLSLITHVLLLIGIRGGGEGGWARLCFYFVKHFVLHFIVLKVLQYIKWIWFIDWIWSIWKLEWI